MKKLILLLLILTSCVAKKSINKENITRDTIYSTKIIKEVERFTDTLLIENPCDSVTGKLKPFNELIKLKQGNIRLSNINNAISAEIDLDGYKQILEQKYKSKYKSEVVEVVKYKTPLYHWLIHLILILIIVLLFRY